MSNKVKRRLKKDALKRERRLARKLATYSLAAGASLFAAGAAEAIVVNDFTGAFAPGNWTVWQEDAQSTKTVTFLNADTTMEIRNNFSPNTVSGGALITAPGTGTISFTYWHHASGYTGIDSTYCDPNVADPEDTITNFQGTVTGTKTYNIVEGEDIVFRMMPWYTGALLQAYGIDPQLQIYDFVADYTVGGGAGAVAEPGALSLLALGAAGAAGLRRRRS